jgi:hypothetical protein
MGPRSSAAGAGVPRRGDAADLDHGQRQEQPSHGVQQGSQRDLAGGRSGVWCPAGWRWAWGVTSGVLGAGAGIGLVAGGLIVDHGSWRWLFATP